MQVAIGLVRDEGLPHRVRRHAVSAHAFRCGVEAMGLPLFPDPRVWSDTVSCFRAPAGIAPAAVVRQMRERYGIFIGTGLDRIRAHTLRVGTMGMTASPHYLLPTLSALELALRDLGHKPEPGAGVAAAQAAFADACAASVEPR
jgi:(S)-ureidoglycine-glyoxylate aminotransferase